MKFLDQFFERSTRHVASTTSRRRFLGRLGSFLVAGAAMPVLLPVDRTAKALAAESPKAGDPGTRPAVTTGATAPWTAFFAVAVAAP